MASVSSGDGDKLNTELNLVPFIDLLSTLVLFLLISAVWLQISSIQGSVSVKGKRSVSNEAPEDRLMITVTPNGHELLWPANIAGKETLPTNVAKVGPKYDFAQLKAVLQTAGKDKPLASAAVGAEDDVNYGLLIETIDTVKLAGVGSIVMSAN